MEAAILNQKLNPQVCLQPHDGFGHASTYHNLRQADDSGEVIFPLYRDASVGLDCPIVQDVDMIENEYDDD